MAGRGVDSRKGKGNTQILKLLIKYRKKQGKKGKPFSIHTVSCSMDLKLMWNFYMRTDCGKKMLDVIATKHQCKVSLSTDDDFKEFFTFQILKRKFLDEPDVQRFVDDVLRSIHANAQETLAIISLEIDPRIEDDVKERISEKKELACAWIEWIGEDKPITMYIVSHKDHQQTVMHFIKEKITDATRSINSHNKMVMADIMWQMVMTEFGYLKEISLQFPSTEITQDKSHNAFVLKGPRDEVNAAAGLLEELLKIAHNEVHEEVFSPRCQFEIFASSEMCKYINKSLPKLPVVWIPDHQTQEIHLFSRDPEQLKVMGKRIKDCIKERFYPLLKDNTKLPFEKTHLLEELKKKYKGRIVINILEPPTGLLVTTAGDIFGDVDVAMWNIISSEIGTLHSKTCVPETHDGRDGKTDSNTEHGTTNLDVKINNFSSEISDSSKDIVKSVELTDKNIFRKLLKEHMEKFNQMATEHCVSIEKYAKESRVGFELKGMEKGVMHVAELIRKTEKEQMQLQQVKAEEPGLKQYVWSYPNDKKIILTKASSCDADCIIIPGNIDKDSLSHSGDPNVVRFKIPDGTDENAMTILQQKVNVVLNRILENTVGTRIKAIKGWKLHHYLKSFLHGICKYFRKNEGKPCPIKCVILLVEDSSDYNEAMEVIQKSIKMELDKSDVFKSQELLLQEQGPHFRRIKVKVQKGQLHAAKVDVLVNTVDRSLDMTRGVISSSLLDKAGNGIQQELQQYQGKFRFGEVLKTTAGTLPKPCMAIFHGVLYFYEEHLDSLKVFQDFIAGCLEDADKMYQSIAFPPIGTGKLCYPKDVVASMLFQSVAKFEKAHPSSKLEEVIFVIYESDEETLKANIYSCKILFFS